MRHTSVPAAPDAGVARLAVSFKTRAADGGLNHFGNLRAFLALADSDLDAGALGYAAVPCCFQLTNVHECLGPADHGDKPEALLGIEPFDDRFDRSRCSCRARTRIIWPNSRCSIVRFLIVVITAALRLTVVVFVTAHSTSV